MKIGIVCHFLPRLELDHLAEWIDHHRSIGFDHFFMYNNGMLSADKHFGTGEASQVWAKKPEANYHLDLDDDAIREGIDAIFQHPNRASLVTEVDWPTRFAEGEDFNRSQRRSISDCLALLRKSEQVEWLACIDPDELIVCPYGDLKAFIASTGASQIVMRQKVFESRWGSGGRAVPYSSITHTFGNVKFNPKCLCRVKDVKRWENVHRSAVRGKKVVARPAELRFHHFRGNRHHGKVIKWAIPCYKALRWRGLHDGSHLARGDRRETPCIDTQP